MEAMKASLLEAEQNGLVDPSPQPSCELGQNIADTGSGTSLSCAALRSRLPWFRVDISVVDFGPLTSACKIYKRPLTLQGGKAGSQSRGACSGGKKMLGPRG